MPITKATASSIAPAAKGDLVVGSATNDAAVLGVGSNDQVLTADSSTATGLKWGTIAAGSMTLLSTTTLSGATTTISGISGSYTHLFGVVYGVTNATGNGNFAFQANAQNIIAYTGFALNNNANGYGGCDLSLGYLPERSVATNAWQFIIYNYASTATRKPIEFSGLWVNQFSPSGNPGAGFGGGGVNTTSAVTSLVFYNSGGNLSSGTVLLYGVN